MSSRLSGDGGVKDKEGSDCDGDKCIMLFCVLTMLHSESSEWIIGVQLLIMVNDES